jgi:hypothetical protein
MAVTYRLTTITDVQVVRRDEVTTLDQPVALNEDLLPGTEIRIMQVPGASAGSCVIQKRESAVNSGPRTLKPRSPEFCEVSALWAGHVAQTLSPYTVGN